MLSARFSVLVVVVIGALALAVAAAARGAFLPAAGPEAIAVRDIVPADGARLPGRPTRIGATVVGERDLRRVTLLVNARPVEPTIEPRGTQHWVVTYQAPAEPGPQEVQLTAVDVYGRQRVQGWRFTIDPLLSAPVINALRPPADGYAPAGGARIGATVRADAPLDTATLLVGPPPTRPTQCSEPSQTPLDTAGLQGGGRVLMATIEPAGPGMAMVTRLVALTPGAYQAMLTVVDREGDRSAAAWCFIVPDPKELLAFEQTGKAIGGGFRRFWEQRGGLVLFGLPISDELTEDGRTVQYFERARFEEHPSQDGALSEVQLGLVGAELRRPDPPRPPVEGASARYFGETGHALAGPFQRFWEEQGGLAVFGLPLTDELRDGALTVQYFERARFELHSTSSGPQVVLGPVGRERYERRYGAATPRP